MAHHLLIFIFGILGNIISFMVYLAPAPTFWRVYKKKSTEGFQSLPYVCAIFSSMLWIYYALLKTNSFLLITINGFGCVIETFYVAVFLAYAPKQAKMTTVKILVVMNFLGFSAIVIGCNYLAKGSIRVAVLGWLCVAFAVVVFAAPLSIIRTVIRTKSVEYLPFPLSLSLTISAVMWFMYGLLQMDIYIVLPNVLGFTFGVAQMILYGIYRNHGKAVKGDIEMKLPETAAGGTPVKTNEASNINAEIHPVCSLSAVDTVKREVEVGMNNDKENDNDDDNNCSQFNVHVPPSCGINEINSPAAPTAVQIMSCAG